MLMNEWQELSWQEYELVENKKYAILPLGALEQHGPHMKLGTDNFLAEGVARLLSEKIKGILLPTINYGQVWSLKRFPGSLSLSTETLKAIIKDIARGVKFQGVQYLIIVNSHIGNMTAVKEAAREIYDEIGFRVIYFTYPGINEIAKNVCQSPKSHPSIIHACEIETSMMLYVDNTKVDMNKAVTEYPEYPPGFDETPIYWDEVSSFGVFGDAKAATRQKGEQIINSVLDNMITIIENITRRDESAKQ